MRKKVLSQQTAAIYDLASIIRQQKLRLNISQEKVVFYYFMDQTSVILVALILFSFI